METTAAYLARSVFLPLNATATSSPPELRPRRKTSAIRTIRDLRSRRGSDGVLLVGGGRSIVLVASALEKSAGGVTSGGGTGSGSSAGTGKKAGGSGAVPNSNYVVTLDKASCLTRPLAEILRDLNKRVPDNIINHEEQSIPWYHANRMLSFYAPGWCGEIRDVIFSDNGSVTVIYRVTVRGTDGEAHRESSGTVSPNDGNVEDPVAAAEAIAFCRACARFGLGLYLYHEDETP